MHKRRAHLYSSTLLRLAAAIPGALLFFVALANAQGFIPTNDPPFYGPYNATILADGDGIKKPLVKGDTVLRADSPWTLYTWLKPDEIPNRRSLIAGFGKTEDEYSRYLGVDNGKLILWMGKDNSLATPAALTAGKWQFVAVSFDGRQFQIYSAGSRVAGGNLELGSTSDAIQIAPASLPWTDGKHFSGQIAGLTLLRRALTADEIKQLSAKQDNLDTVLFEEGSKPWPVQTRGQAGYRAPQSPMTLPHSSAAPQSPSARTIKPSAALTSSGNDEWTLSAWTLRPAPDVKDAAERISQNGFPAKDWWAATVPGTVLTTMIDRGIYPDPDYGLNNLAIPETLNKQDYWYRTEFTPPAEAKSRRLTLDFEGINYFAEVWLNGKQIGTIKGAFVRGIFDITDTVQFGKTNTLAVRVSPPPHPGIPHEQSIKAGPGENGGIMCLDGPTFVATEGWDWMPAIRDRDTGIWQRVTLRATGAVRIGDPQIVTKLPLPDTSSAEVEISVPLKNGWASAVNGTLTASFEGVTITKNVSAGPGKSIVKLTPAEFSQLTVKNPRLWWPNGYGAPELYTLKIAFTENGHESDHKETRFGIREVTYEISLMDSTGHLKRVEFAPSKIYDKDVRVVDIRHEGIRNIPAPDPFPKILPEEWREGWKGWVASLAPDAEKSPAIRMVDDLRAAPYLTIKVNGVRIAARGGSWGMDDSRKRVSRQRLEPYFRLHRDANVNIIRNWVGQSTEETFFELADEYGLMVWNDFWASTQDYNVEPEDPALFIENARDTIERFRNHPSIVLWCGRNEGVPQPSLNEALDELIRQTDGTRYYSPTSNQVNLQNSGPYRYVDPKLYFTILNHGFSVETGTPSFPTLETWRAWIPEGDLWPISDNWAYHDWHQSGNGDMVPFMAEMEREFGAPVSLEDFERKAQMMNYVQHRAIFEGMDAHLWAPNTGRMLWMTQPAWPSSTWQIISSDYDTQASYYATKKGSELLHVQMDPNTYAVEIANSLPQTTNGLTAKATAYSLDNKVLVQHDEKKDAPTGTTEAFVFNLAEQLKDTVTLVKLELHDANGKLLSDNFYWIADDTANYRKLNHMAPAKLAISVTRHKTDGADARMTVRVENTGTNAAIQTKLTLLASDGKTRVLPAYYSDNYISLLPGEVKEVEISSPKNVAPSGVTLGIRGWNVAEQTIKTGM